MRIAAAVLLTLMLASPAWADTLTVGSRVLSDGDSTGKVYELLGKPDRVIASWVGNECFEYYRDGKTIRIEIRDGTVESIQQET